MRINIFPAPEDDEITEIGYSKTNSEKAVKKDGNYINVHDNEDDYIIVEKQDLLDLITALQKAHELWNKTTQNDS